MLEALFYGVNPELLGIGTLILLILAAEVGFRIGRRRAASGKGGGGSQITTLLGAILGFLALVLSFTFSGSYSRFDTRRQLVIKEANAIETTYLRAQTMSEPQRERTSELLRRYVMTRVPAANAESVRQAIAEAGQLHDELWAEAVRFSRSDADPARKTLLLGSLNETIDLHTERVAAYLFRAPPVVLLGLELGALLAVFFMGYATGLDGRRHLFGLTVMVVLITLLLTVIVDLESGTKGLIHPSQQPLLDVQHNIGAPAAGEPSV